MDFLTSPIHRQFSRSTTLFPSPRLQELSSLFDLPSSPISAQSWSVHLDLPSHWNIGLIVGPSGSGKSTIACELFSPYLPPPWPWPADRSLLDGFPLSLSVPRICDLLCGVGFSSPPAWLRPFRTLSTGQQFRATLARTLAEMPDLAVVDEYTTSIDRTLACLASSALARTVRSADQKFVAVTCHYDVLHWLQPDWLYEAHTGRFQSGRLGLRPPLDLHFIRLRRSAWDLFKPHHYLTGSLHPSSMCFGALYASRLVAFTAVLPFPHPIRPGWREHRTVCLPDFQGVGIGHALSEFVASLFSSTAKPYTSTTSHPAMIRHRLHSPLWRLTRPPAIANPPGRSAFPSLASAHSPQRKTAGFQYIGPSRPSEARTFGIKT